MSAVGVILSTMGDTQYHGGTMMHVGDIMSTVGDTILCNLSTVRISQITKYFSPWY